MFLIAVDDEELARKSLVRSLNEVFPDDEIAGFSKAEQAIACVKEKKEKGEVTAYAFLDIKLRGMNGIELAREIKNISPSTRILFVTAYNEYAYEAYQVHARGYILKPVDAMTIRNNLRELEIDWKKEPDLNQITDKRLYAVTFGCFDAFADGKSLTFERAKAKELLAYLIDKNGAGVTNAQIEAALFEESNGEKRKSKYVSKIIAALMATLKNTHLEDAVIRKRNYLAINKEKVDCDYYQFMKGDIHAVNSYQGTYMENYEWAEMTAASLEFEKNGRFRQ